MTAEIERMIANMVRVGTVSAVDVPNKRVKLKVGGLTTAWLPWGAGRAGKTRTWSAPTVGEQRVLFSPYGDMAQGVVGQAIYQDDYDAPATSADQEHVLFPDGSTVDYNSASNTLTVTVAGNGNVVINCKHATINAQEDATVNTKAATINAEDAATVNTKVATIKASDSTEIDSPATTVTGTMTVQGLLTYQAGLSGSGGSGASLSGPLALAGDYSSTGGMSNNGKQVGSDHTHREQGNGAPTSPPL